MIFPYRIQGPDDPDVPIVFDSPHSGSAYPPDFRCNFGPERFRREEDMDIDDLFSGVISMKVPQLVALFPRLYCDVNRAYDDYDPTKVAGVPTFPPNPTEHGMRGKGVVWTVMPPDGSPLSPDKLTALELERRVNLCWRPYRNALGRLLNNIHARHGIVHYIDCHSMLAVANALHADGQGARRPDITLGDLNGTSCNPEFTRLLKLAFREEGFTVKLNDPHKGGDLLRQFGRPSQGFHAIQVIVNRRLYMDEAYFVRSRRYRETKARIERAMELVIRIVGNETRRLNDLKSRKTA